MAPSLSRRAVVRGLGASAASLVFPLRAWAVAASDPPAVCAGYRPRVAAGWVPAGEPGAFERALRSVVDASTDFAWLAPGDRVLVKVASNSGSRFPATSSPAALFALARLLYTRGAGRVWVGDQAGVHLVHHTRHQRKGSTRALMQQNGLWQAATAAGAVPLAFEEAGYDAYLADPVPGGGPGPRLDGSPRARSRRPPLARVDARRGDARRLGALAARRRLPPGEPGEPLPGAAGVGPRRGRAHEVPRRAARAPPARRPRPRPRLPRARRRPGGARDRVGGPHAGAGGGGRVPRGLHIGCPSRVHGMTRATDSRR